jgi:hypothetical protein
VPGSTQVVCAVLVGGFRVQQAEALRETSFIATVVDDQTMGTVSSFAVYFVP